MNTAFLIIAGFTLASAAAAVSLRNLVHCALCTVLAFVGLAAAYLQLHAQFIGFAQILVYVGAVAILIVFAVLLTKSNETKSGSRTTVKSWLVGAGIAAAVSGTLIYAAQRSAIASMTRPAAPTVSVKRIGEHLMSEFVLPLEITGLLLTAALIGAVIIALPLSSGDKDGRHLTRVGGTAGKTRLNSPIAAALESSGNRSSEDNQS